MWLVVTDSQSTFASRLAERISNLGNTSKVLDIARFDLVVSTLDRDGMSWCGEHLALPKLVVPICDAHSYTYYPQAILRQLESFGVAMIHSSLLLELCNDPYQSIHAISTRNFEFPVMRTMLTRSPFSNALLQSYFTLPLTLIVNPTASSLLCYDVSSLSLSVIDERIIVVNTNNQLRRLFSRKKRKRTAEEQAVAPALTSESAEINCAESCSSPSAVTSLPPPSSNDGVTSSASLPNESTSSVPLLSSQTSTVPLSDSEDDQSAATTPSFFPVNSDLTPHHLTLQASTSQRAHRLPHNIPIVIMNSTPFTSRSALRVFTCLDSVVASLSNCTDPPLQSQRISILPSSESMFDVPPPAPPTPLSSDQIELAQRVALHCAKSLQLMYACIDFMLNPSNAQLVIAKISIPSQFPEPVLNDLIHPLASAIIQRLQSVPIRSQLPDAFSCELQPEHQGSSEPIKH